MKKLMKPLLILTTFILSTNLWANFRIPNNFHMDFIQVIKSEISGKVRKSKGHIDYKYPGQIRFKVEDKVSSIFISNTHTQWYYTPPFIEGEQGEVRISKNHKNILTDLFDIIKKYGEKKNKHYEIVKISTKQISILF